MNKALALLDLLTIDAIFKEVGGEMFLLYGTALGAYREGDFIEGDDDIDLGSFDIHLRDKIAEKMREKGFEVSTCWDEKIQGYRESIMIHASHDVHIDIFFFIETKEGFTASRGVEEEIFVLLPPKTKKRFESVKLSGHTFKVLSPIEDYLEFCYNDWTNPKHKDHGKLYHHLKGDTFEYSLFT